MNHKVYELKLCKDRELQIEGVKFGNFWWIWAANLLRQDVPTMQDVLNASQGKWIYRPVRLFIAVDKPAVDLRLDVYTHNMLKGVKREYIFPDVYMPQFQQGTSEGIYQAVLDKYFYHIVLLTMPGDRIFLRLMAEHKFEGELKVLYCVS
jgi:hypothetical protein